ncbi:MAG: hypothetical protein AABX59_01830 [Nanoarchaeota archaeon]
MPDLTVYRWGYIFLKADSKLPLVQSLELITEAIDMHVTQEESRDIKNGFCEGRIYTKREYFVIGSLGGRKYYVEVETNRGKVEFDFLLKEQTWNYDAKISRN